MSHKTPLFLLLSLLLLQLSTTSSQPFIGVNYGQLADNLPPNATAKLLQSTSISKLRLYGSDPSIIRALAGTNISLIISVSNADIPSIAADQSAAATWVSANVLPFLPASTISAISVGNEVFGPTADPTLPSLLPAMRNVHSALQTNPLSSSICVSTAHTMAILSHSDPPSSTRISSPH